MKTKNSVFVTLLLLALAHFALSQRHETLAATSSLTNRQVIDAWITNTETHIVPLAETMPGDKYSFAPIGDGFKDVRTFAEQLKHLAANNYSAAAKILGEKPIADQANEKGPDSIKTKAKIIEYVKGSFAALHKAVATIDKKNEVEPLKDLSGTWQRTRLGLAIDAVVHSFDHYGQLVEYLRMNRIIPPASR